jgi:hypothetical protein
MFYWLISIKKADQNIINHSQQWSNIRMQCDWKTANQHNYIDGSQCVQQMLKWMENPSVLSPLVVLDCTLLCKTDKTLMFSFTCLKNVGLLFIDPQLEK